MSRRAWVVVCIFVVSLSLLSLGCAKKQPVTPPAPEEPAPAPEPAQEVETAEEPPTTGDQQPDPWSQDLQTAQKAAYDQGLLADIHFAFDRSNLQPEARDRLAKNADFMREHPEFTFTIEGHCDERGTNEYNLALGDRRANAAYEYLVSLGIDGSRLKTISYGEERPQCTESDESCWWRNRRAHFVISGRTDVG